MGQTMIFKSNIKNKNKTKKSINKEITLIHVYYDLNHITFLNIN